MKYEASSMVKTQDLGKECGQGGPKLRSRGWWNCRNPVEVRRLVEYQEEAWGRGENNRFFPTPSPAASLTLPTEVQAVQSCVLRKFLRLLMDRADSVENNHLRKMEV